MVINSFIKRNNTIIRNSNINTSNNPVVELFYGGVKREASRYIFSIDYMRIFNEFIEGNFSINYTESIKHVLRMYNTSFFDYRLHEETFLGYSRASSFDLILYKLEDSFDEGFGYDQNDKGLTVGKKVISTKPSNGIYAKTDVKWSQDFAVDTSNIESIKYFENGEFFIKTRAGLAQEEIDRLNSLVINIQHFETGKENLEMDITEHIAAVISAMHDSYLLGDVDQMNFISENNNFCLAFLPQMESLDLDQKQYVGFFSKYANSAYSPFLQSIMNDTIEDDRTNFVANKTNRLYMYSRINGKYKDFITPPTVYIVKDPDISFDNINNLIHKFEPIEVKQSLKGIYYVEFEVSSSMVSECEVYYDVWEVSYHSGPNTLTENIEQSFSVKDASANSIGEYRQPDNYSVSLFYNGVNRDERVNRGERRNIYITPKIKFTSNQKDEKSNIKYRLYSKEGINEIPVIDWLKTDKLSGGDRLFVLDTLSLLPNSYYVDLLVEKENDLLIEKEFITFRVISSPVFNKQNKIKGYRPNIKIKDSCDGSGDGNYIIDITNII